MQEVVGFDTPEEAALAGWPRAAAPILEAIERQGSRAQVVLDVNGGYRYWVTVERRQGRWVELSSGNGPNLVWEGE